MKKSIPNEILLPEVARLIKEGHTVTITVRGNSTVLARDLTERIVFHRIIRRNGDILILQGDGNLAQTEETDIGRVMGVMTEAMRKDKRYTADGKVWKLYSYWWMKLNPARRWLLALFRRI